MTLFSSSPSLSQSYFFAYLDRSPASESSPIHKFVGKTFTAFISSLSFLIGANCSAISGYAGIWVSVRANVRVTAAAKRDYNAALVICFRGGVFSAIINFALTIFCISFLNLFLVFVFYTNAPNPSNPIPIEDIPFS